MNETVTPEHSHGADLTAEDDAAAETSMQLSNTHNVTDADAAIEADAEVDSVTAMDSEAPVPAGKATDVPELTALLAAAVSAEIEPLLAGIGAAIDRFHDRTAAQEQSARTLQAHVETLQRDQVRQLLKPTFERLATLHAEAQRATESTGDNTQAADDFAFFAESIEELLALYDLSSVEATVGGDFDARLHHAQRAVATSEKELSGKIQRVLRQGFGFAGATRVLLPARVTVYRLSLPADATVADLACVVAPAESPAVADPTQPALLTSEQHRNETA